MTERIWYLAFCVNCNGGIDKLIAGDPSVIPMPFSTQGERIEWITAHMDGTQHAVLLMDQHVRGTNDATTHDGSDKETTVHQTG